MAAFEATGLPIVTFDRPGLSTLWRDTWFLRAASEHHADALAELKPAAVIVTMNAPFAWPFTRCCSGGVLRSSTLPTMPNPILATMPRLGSA